MHLPPDEAPGRTPPVNDLFADVYDQLRRMARGAFQGREAGFTLQPTALVNECYMRLAKLEGDHLVDRDHFLAVAATAMRQLLADHARRKFSLKRGGGQVRVGLDQVSGLGHPDTGLDLGALDEALTKLSELDARQARIVELRFLAGLSVTETARLLGISERTLYLDWEMARSWLSRRLSGSPS